MLPPKTDVVPDDNARARAESLKRWIIAEVVVLTPLIFAGQIWIIFQLLTAIPGWLAVHNKLVFSIRLLTIYFLASVFGVVFISVDMLTSLSILVASPPPPGESPSAGTNPAPLSGPLLLFATTYLGAASVILTLASHSAWSLIKYAYVLPPSMQASNSYALPLNPAAYTSQLFSGRRGSDAGGSNQGFVPFQGTGRRVQEV